VAGSAVARTRGVATAQPATATTANFRGSRESIKVFQRIVAFDDGPCGGVTMRQRGLQASIGATR
jgi:hypothetical protein